MEEFAGKYAILIVPGIALVVGMVQVLKHTFPNVPTERKPLLALVAAMVVGGLIVATDFTLDAMTLLAYLSIVVMLATAAMGVHSAADAFTNKAAKQLDRATTSAKARGYSEGFYNGQVSLEDNIPIAPEPVEADYGEEDDNASNRIA